MSRTVHYDTNGNEIYEEDCTNDTPTYAQEQLADIEHREAVNHPSYYKTGGIEAIDVIEAWNLAFISATWSNISPVPGARQKTACKTSRKPHGILTGKSRGGSANDTRT